MHHKPQLSFLSWLQIWSEVSQHKNLRYSHINYTQSQEWCENNVWQWGNVWREKNYTNEVRKAFEKVNCKGECWVRTWLFLILGHRQRGLSPGSSPQCLESVMWKCRCCSTFCVAVTFYRSQGCRSTTPASKLSFGLCSEKYKICSDGFTVLVRRSARKIMLVWRRGMLPLSQCQLSSIL